ncbi:methylaspartate mutase [Actinokineospora spheciospongiae]|uniref:methylaspartate mutase n=1 Tax=Actinokineospora spheciospongiae TaxID=909613 RepID=UPI000D993C8E|nr:methylaspartate mutase [Actinokineospora spheciospongiae]PWW54819.1 glutamate mutase subunit E [Actinokineospora spheciospongiae]
MSFGRFVKRAGALVVQPRMGFGDPVAMRDGLRATRDADATTVGTLTLDSYTRVGDHQAAAKALRERAPLNGYPIVSHSTETTAALLDGIRDSGFPVQVRHGSAQPQDIVHALTAAGLDATEGGPISYCLPYGRTPIRESIANWRETCELLAEHADTPHLESFGGCLLGQLCPPGLLVAVSVLEALFFTRYGITSVSLSYAQQTHPAQDEEAIRALRTLAARYLPAGTDWHVVLYGYMGVYPTTRRGALRLLQASAELAARTGTERLIVKTVAEAHRIPTIAENVQALEVAATAARETVPTATTADTGILGEAKALVEAVLDLDDDLGRAFAEAFARGLLDVPFCLHPDNAGQSRSTVGADGRLRWTAVGAMPIVPTEPDSALTSDRLLTALTHVARSFDR